MMSWKIKGRSHREQQHCRWVCRPTRPFVFATTVLFWWHSSLDVRVALAGVCFLIGIEADEPDPELGYIVPGNALDVGAFEIEAFVEKPPVTRALALIDRGSWWNAFVVVTDARALLRLFETVRRLSDGHVRSAISSGEVAQVNLAERSDDLLRADQVPGLLGPIFKRVLPVRSIEGLAGQGDSTSPS
jgi:hypothetical protein